MAGDKSILPLTVATLLVAALVRTAADKSSLTTAS